MTEKKLTTNAGAPVVDNQNVMTAGARGPALLQDVWFLEILAHFDREVIPERRMHANTKANVISQVGKQAGPFARFWDDASELHR